MNRKTHVNVPTHVWLRKEPGVGTVAVASRGQERLAEYPAWMNDHQLPKFRHMQRDAHWRFTQPGATAA